MAISLFPHNQTAYEAAVAMLSETGKAAVIHPTGTGKSFIGFKLCEEHPDKRICWVSPSEYIFRTQLENLSSVSGGYTPQNITFLTYAKLSIMSGEEIGEVKPDYIILDEFHRCGAKEWGNGVRKLLDSFPGVPLLGFTATNIRYLDRQRDMADELFENHVASRMTLGEALVRGILNTPRYVLSVYSYRKDLQKYEQRARAAKNPVVRKSAETYVEALRRKLEKADGLDRMFDRHMTDRTGRYLVFCANAEHMDEMIAKVPEWFRLVDEAPHVYRAYADDPGTAKAFEAFKADESSHLKLLFCIDMLNEGVHVDRVSGVILLRPTVSPIIYKQQIGRALSAGAVNNAVIFDVVLNVRNLYSINEIQGEMQAAITYYRYLGEYARVVNERFTVIDETQDVRRLFSELEKQLCASWDLMLQEARKYYREHGDLLVPAKYKTESGLSLGNWLNLQRKIYHGKAEGFLSEEQIRELEGVGVVWDSYLDQTWEKNYLECKAYFNEYGDLRVPSKYVTESGFPLGVWIARMRQAKANDRTGILTEERIRKLEEIGMTWSVLSDQWEKNFREAERYYEEHGNLLVPGRYVTESGLKLGSWIAHLRMIKSGKGSGRLTKEQTARLDMIGMAWDADEERWRIGYDAAVRYSREHGNLDVPVSYETKDGCRLGRWISLKRRQYKNGTLTEEQAEDLTRLGMCWEVRTDRWQEMYDEARAFYEANGNLKVPRERKTRGGKSLSQWIARMKRESGKLSEGQREMLEEIGVR